jgi:hypothetical protein
MIGGFGANKRGASVALREVMRLAGRAGASLPGVYPWQTAMDGTRWDGIARCAETRA